MDKARGFGWLLVAMTALLIIAPGFAATIPPGYRLLQSDQASGGVLIARGPAQTTAADVLIRGFRDVAPTFDRPPQALASFQDGAGRAGAAFSARIGGSVVGGLAFAHVKSGNGIVGFAFDSPTTLKRTLPILLTLALSSGGAPGSCPPAPRSWQMTFFPDGSGQMELPDGWQIVGSQQGQVFAEGPHGWINRGFNTPIITRAGAAQAAAIGPPFPVADPSDPVAILQVVWPRLSAANQQRGLPGFRITRIIEAAWEQVPQGLAQGAIVHLEFDRGGVRHQGLSRVILGPVMPGGTYLYYESNVASRAECFGENLPILVHIWDSTQTASDVIRGRLAQAMDSLRGASDIWWQGYWRRDDSLRRSHDNWTEAFRGTRIIEKIGSAERQHVNLAESREIVDWLNRQGGPQYREIPLAQLNQPPQQTR